MAHAQYCVGTAAGHGAHAGALGKPGARVRRSGAPVPSPGPGVPRGPGKDVVGRLSPLVAVAVGFAAGAVPFSNLGARRFAGVDLRVGWGHSGTVSGSALYEVAGRGPGGGRAAGTGQGRTGTGAGRAGPPWAAALAGGAAVTGHNWSPLLGGAGGRGISPAMGALLVNGPMGTLVLGAGLAVGKFAGETALGCLVADLALVPVARRAHGRRGAVAAGAVLLPMLAKRLAGNGRRLPVAPRYTFGASCSTATAQAGLAPPNGRAVAGRPEEDH